MTEGNKEAEDWDKSWSIDPLRQAWASAVEEEEGQNGNGNALLLKKQQQQQALHRSGRLQPEARTRAHGAAP